MVLLNTPAGLLGMSAPAFSLMGVDGHYHALADYDAASVLVVMFTCNHCPYVQAIEPRLIHLAQTFADRKTVFVAINSNDSVRYPDDDFENMKIRAREKGYPFDYLSDENQEVARAYGAVCTPDLYVFDKDRKLTYRGRLDDSPRNPAAVKSEDLRRAIEKTLAGESVAAPQHPSMGCSIKWKEEV